MVKYENECCGCAKLFAACIGNACPNRNVKHLYCDKCGCEVEKLFVYDEEELCRVCLLSGFDTIE